MADHYHQFDGCGQCRACGFIKPSQAIPKIYDQDGAYPFTIYRHHGVALVTIYAPGSIDIIAEYETANKGAVASARRTVANIVAKRRTVEPQTVQGFPTEAEDETERQTILREMVDAGEPVDIAATWPVTTLRTVWAEVKRLRAVEPQPVEPQPAEPQPVEPQPVEPQPVEPQTEDDSEIARRAYNAGWQYAADYPHATILPIQYSGAEWVAGFKDRRTIAIRAIGICANWEG